MFYEHNRSSANQLAISQKPLENFRYRVHLHESYELICVSEGLVRVEINGLFFDVRAGEGALILPYQSHAYETPNTSLSCLVIFSPDHIPELKELLGEDKIRHPVVRLPRADFWEAASRASANPLRLRSLLYEVAAIYLEGEAAPHLLVKDGPLVCKIVEYIGAHYTESMSLSSMAKELGYSYRYLSGVINRFFKLPLPSLVNKYRINYARELLSQSDTDITKIALLCGFGSMRNFNRSFHLSTGLTPREYRSAKNKA